MGRHLSICNPLAENAEHFLRLNGVRQKKRRRV
jgi:hypothetical protein